MRKDQLMQVACRVQAEFGFRLACRDSDGSERYLLLLLIVCIIFTLGGTCFSVLADKGFLRFVSFSNIINVAIQLDSIEI